MFQRTCNNKSFVFLYRSVSCRNAVSITQPQIAALGIQRRVEHLKLCESSAEHLRNAIAGVA